MRIAYVAGFFKHVLPELQNRLKGHLESGAVVWIPPYGRTDEPNINRFKGDFLSAVDRGATEILICLFIMRGKTDLFEYVNAIIDLGKGRAPGLNVMVERFKSARDADGVIGAINTFGPTVVLPFPSDLTGLEQWIAKKHGGKLILHARATDAMKKSIYRDTPLIYSAVDLLAEEYRNMRMAPAELAPEAHGRCTDKLQELGLELSYSISSSRAGEQGDEYFVTYPPGGVKKRMLEFHLKKGSDRDERYSLRIYFFWDGDSKRVVIGWLPGHLDTRGTWGTTQHGYDGRSRWAARLKPCPSRNSCPGDLHGGQSCSAR